MLLLVLLHAAPVLIPGWEAPQADVLGASPILAATGAALDIARLALLAVVATSVVRGVGKSPSNQWIAEEMLDM